MNAIHESQDKQIQKTTTANSLPIKFQYNTGETFSLCKIQGGKQIGSPICKLTATNFCAYRSS